MPHLRSLPMLLAASLAVAGCDRASPDGAGATPASDTPEAPQTVEHAPTGAPPQLVFAVPRVNFGVVPETETRETTVEFTNAGGSELIIEAVKTTCGCTAAEPRKRNYAPGEVGLLDVEFDPSSPGEQTRTITVFTNAGQATLDVLANVQVFVDVEPRILKPGILRHGRPHRLSMTLNCPDPHYTVDGVTTSNPHVKARALPHEPGQPTTVEIDVAPTAEWGPLFSWVRITVSGHPQPGAERITHTAEVRVQGQLWGNLRAQPDTFRFGVQPGQEFERIIKLYRIDGEPFSLLSATLEGDLHQATLTPRPAGEGVYELVLEAAGGPTPGQARGTVVLQTDVPGEERLVLNVTGVVRDRFGR